MTRAVRQAHHDTGKVTLSLSKGDEGHQPLAYITCFMKVPGRYHVYILHCSDGSYYIGVTNDPERRLEEHQGGLNPECYTYSRRPLKLVYTEEFQNVLHAIAREKQLKKWSRAKKEALISSDYAALSFHAMNSGRKRPMQDESDLNHPSTSSG